MTAPHIAPPVLTRAQRETLAQAIDDAIDYRYPGACADCDDAAAGLCGVCADDLARADAYAALGRELGIGVAM